MSNGGSLRASPMEAPELREQRLRLGLSQNQLAKLFRVSQSTINQWERGASRITAPGALRLAFERLAEQQAIATAGGIAPIEPSTRLGPAALRADRLRLGLSQREFARRLGISDPLLYLLEHDTRWSSFRESARALLDEIEQEALALATSAPRAEAALAPAVEEQSAVAPVPPRSLPMDYLTDEEMALIATDPTRSPAELARELGRPRSAIVNLRLRILRDGWVCHLTWKTCTECGEPLAVPQRHPQRKVHLSCETARRVRLGRQLAPRPRRRPGIKGRDSGASHAAAAP